MIRSNFTSTLLFTMMMFFALLGFAQVSDDPNMTSESSKTQSGVHAVGASTGNQVKTCPTCENRNNELLTPNSKTNFYFQGNGGGGGGAVGTGTGKSGTTD